MRQDLTPLHKAKQALGRAHQRYHSAATDAQQDVLAAALNCSVEQLRRRAEVRDRHERSREFEVIDYYGA